MDARDHSEALLDQVRQAAATGRPLAIHGGGSKSALGRPVQGEPLDTTNHRGIVHYDPCELVVTARAGTPLAELIDTLAEQDQMLPFEPPLFGGGATVGGMVATGLAGPRRPWAGSVRDFVLGTRVITGAGQALRFGGEVMKNVAGYDVSRLMAGSFGCLGLISEVSLKVLPRPRASATVRLTLARDSARECILRWRHQGLPLTAACHHEQQLTLRLEGNRGSVDAARRHIGGEPVDDGEFWARLRDHRLPFFTGPGTLWRLSLPIAGDHPALPGASLMDWGGAQYWLKSNSDAAAIREWASGAGGWATCFAAAAGVEPFHPLPAALMHYHRALKAQLDPQGIFNPGRLYADL